MTGIFTALVRSTTGGYVFTGVCLLTPTPPSPPPSQDRLGYTSLPGTAYAGTGYGAGGSFPQEDCLVHVKMYKFFDEMKHFIVRD